ncbi:hypothetical protein D9611_013181 [Ephemerocybe angulata]|uniref:Uncharacterized protein n=1 Tax=Ephemerocybe angulata TaxID=980116 RepID=A0A8H5BU87_9AGAR|nr:hypothetical protein D9611_013181 [Tulosesus angulatus]
MEDTVVPSSRRGITSSGPVTVHTAPDSFDFSKLYQAACALDCDEHIEDTRGRKRSAPGTDEEDVDNSDWDSWSDDKVEILKGRSNKSGLSMEIDEDRAPQPAPKLESHEATSSKGKNAKRNHSRRAAKRKHDKEEKGRPEPREKVKEKYIPDKPGPSLEPIIRYVNLPTTSCGYHGQKVAKDVRVELGAEDCSLEALEAAGSVEVPWDGKTPEVYVERRTKKILVVLAGGSNIPGYMESIVKAAEVILEAREKAGFTAEELEHYRSSNSAALNVGIYYGGATFKLWFPRVYEDVDKKLRALYDHNPSLKAKKNWAASVYPCAAFNFGPRVACKMHKDSGNAPHTFCAIQALGTFNAEKGGHLIIKELNVHIRFPAGSTIYIPSALFTHGNTPVGVNETRLSITQFVPGGLIRYVDNGFRTEAALRKKSKKLWREKMKEKEARWEKSLELISTLDELTGKSVAMPLTDTQDS